MKMYHLPEVKKIILVGKKLLTGKTGR